MTKTILSGLPVHTLAALGLLLSTTTTAQVLPNTTAWEHMCPPEYCWTGAPFM